MGAPHFSSEFFICLYHKYFSSKIKQLFLVFLGIEEQDERIKTSIKINNLLIRITTFNLYKIKKRIN